MNDLVLETCKYIYKNPNKTEYRYIKEMLERSIWRGSDVAYLVSYLKSDGVLVEKNMYNSPDTVLALSISGFARYYNICYSNKIEFIILDYIINNRKKSKGTIISNLVKIYDDISKLEFYDEFSSLERKGVIRFRYECYNGIKYLSPYVDLYGFKTILKGW